MADAAEPIDEERSAEISAWGRPGNSPRRGSIALLVVFVPIVVAKVLSAYGAGGSAGDRALTIVVAVYGASVVLVAAVGIYVQAMTRRRIRYLDAKFPGGSTFLAYNLSSFSGALRRADPSARVHGTATFSLVVEADCLSIWDGGGQPRRVGTIPGERIEGIDESDAAKRRHGVGLWLSDGNGRFILPVQLRRAGFLFASVEEAARLTEFEERVERMATPA